MTVTSEMKKELIEKYGSSPEDTGSVQSQVAILTVRIKQLTEHFLEHPKDHASRRGLLKLVGKRRSLLNYLKKKDFEAYKQLISELGIRK